MGIMRVRSKISLELYCEWHRTQMRGDGDQQKSTNVLSGRVLPAYTLTQCFFSRLCASEREHSPVELGLHLNGFCSLIPRVRGIR